MCATPTIFMFGFTASNRVRGFQSLCSKMSSDVLQITNMINSASN